MSRTQVVDYVATVGHLLAYQVDVSLPPTFGIRTVLNPGTQDVLLLK